MSWWELEGDEVMGDQPADALASALEASDPKPTLQQFAVAVASALRSSPSDIAEPPSVLSIVFETADATRASADGAADNAFTEHARRALTAVAATYQRRWGRGPTLNEILGCIEFVLGADARPYLADVPRIDSVRAVRAE